MRACFILPSNTISGGIFTVFKHAVALSRKGHEVTIAFMLEERVYRRDIFDALEGVKLKSFRDAASCGRYDLVVATWWETVFLLPQIEAEHVLYFVQGFEDQFYLPSSPAADLVRSTFSHGNKIHYATVSRALAERLKRDFGLAATVVPCGVDLEIFYSARPAISKCDRLRVMVEGLPNVERKQVRFTLEILSRFENLEVVYVSPGGRPDYDASIDYFFQRVPHKQMPSLYKSCDFIVKLSDTESFALPVLEMFATGGAAVVSEFPGQEEYIRHGENALVVPVRAPDATEDAIRRLLSEPELLPSLKANALAESGRWDLCRSTTAFVNMVEELSGGGNGCGETDAIRSIAANLADYHQFQERIKIANH